MALDVTQLFGNMLSAATMTAGQQWSGIKTAVTFELRILAQRLVQIVDLRTTGQIDDDDAKMFLFMAHNNCISNIAMATAMVAVAIRKVVDSALNVVRTAVNTAIGFVLI
jgi:hypothetical protein